MDMNCPNCNRTTNHEHRGRVQVGARPRTTLRWVDVYRCPGCDAVRTDG